jgi:hypothetical protein
MKRLGNQTVTAIHYTAGPNDGYASTRIANFTDVQGCLHEPKVPVAARGGGEARAEKTAEVGVAVATTWWQTKAPPHPAILALLPSDALQVNGVTYQIIAGIHPHVDFSGRINHVTIASERQDKG